jgi:hypothetical protein
MLGVDNPSNNPFEIGVLNVGGINFATASYAILLSLNICRRYDHAIKLEFFE